MTDEHAAQIVRGLTNEKNLVRSRMWLLCGLLVLLVGIAAGGIFLKTRPPAVPIARVTRPVAADSEPTMTFTAHLPAEIPQGG
jgi:hypothetical protein